MVAVVVMVGLSCDRGHGYFIRYIRDDYFYPVQQWEGGLNMNNERTFELEDVRSSGFMSEVVRKKENLKFHPLHFCDKVA